MKMCKHFQSINYSPMEVICILVVIWLYYCMQTVVCNYIHIKHNLKSHLVYTVRNFCRLSGLKSHHSNISFAIILIAIWLWNLFHGNCDSNKLPLASTTFTVTLTKQYCTFLKSLQVIYFSFMHLDNKKIKKNKKKKYGIVFVD